MSIFVEDSDGNKVLPRPECTYADHSYPAYSKAQMLHAANAIEQLESELAALREKNEELQRKLDEAARRELGNPNYERMFNAAVLALAEISEYVGADPDDGGAMPIIEKLKEWKNQEPSAYMFPSDLERFAETETFAQAFSVVVVSPDEKTEPLYRRPPNLHSLIEQAKADEREECAQRFIRLAHSCWTIDEMADAIRTRKP